MENSFSSVVSEILRDKPNFLLYILIATTPLAFGISVFRGREGKKK